MIDRTLEPKRMTDIKLIAFDLDDTLWDATPVLASAELELYQWFVKQCHEPAVKFDLAGLRELRLASIDPRRPTALQITSARRASLITAFETLGFSRQQSRVKAEEGLTIFLAHRQRVTPFIGAHELLSSLKDHYQVVTATNGNADIYATELGPYFEKHYSAEAIGLAKPNPEMLAFIARRHGVSSSQCLLVGDSEKYDATAAYGAAWHFKMLAPASTNHRIDVEGFVDQIGRLP
jgi:HAD superfamily hydrolase (TIGR01509 family)